MSAIEDEFNSAFRDYEIDGSAASGVHEPVKSEIRAIGPVIASALTYVGTIGGISVAHATYAELAADLVHTTGTLALVYDDPDNALVGVYVMNLTISPTAWTMTDFPWGAVSANLQTYVDQAAAWAENPEDTPIAAVSPTQYSALHHAAKAAASAAAAAADAAGVTTGLDTRLNAVEDANVSTTVRGCSNTPVTDSAITNHFFVLSTPIRRAGEISSIQAFGLNSGGTVTIRRFTLSGSTLTQVGSDYTATIAAGLATIVGGTDYTAIPVEENEYIGFQAYSTTGKVPLRALKMPFTPYWRQTVGFTGGALGTFTTTSSVQIQFNITAAGGTDRANIDVAKATLGELVYAGRDTAVVQGASTLNNSSIIYINPVPFSQAGIVERLDLGLSASGPVQVFFFDPQGGGSSLRLMRSLSLQSTGAGANSFTTSSGIPKDLYVEDDWLIGFLSYTTGSGAGMTYTSAGATVDGPGYILTLDASQLANTDMVPTLSTANYRFEYRATVRAVGAPRRIANLPTGLVVDEDFSEGTRPYTLKVNGTWTFAAGTATSGSTGLASLLESGRGQAGQKVQGLDKFQFGDATSCVYAGLKDFAGNYSTLVKIDAAANSWTAFNAWVGGSSEPAGTFQTNASPFAAALANARDYQIEFLQDRRNFTIRLTDLATFETSEITTNFQTWSSSNDLNNIGLMQGSIVVGAKAGSVIAKRMILDIPIREPTILFLSDSMGHSRADWGSSVMGLVETAATGGAVCCHVDGTQGNSFPVLLRHHLRRNPTVRHVIGWFGTNDTSGSQATFEARMAEGVRYALDNNVTVTLLTPPLLSTDLEPYTGINAFITGLATTYGITVVPIHTITSTGGLGVTRDDTLFSTEGGATDVHLNQTYGHPKAFRGIKAYAPHLMLSPF